LQSPAAFPSSGLLQCLPCFKVWRAEDIICFKLFCFKA
jgi:hypothetical protein